MSGLNGIFVGFIVIRKDVFIIENVHLEKRKKRRTPMNNNQYLIKILNDLKVQTKKGIIRFQQEKIYESLIKETSLTKEQAKHICNLTTKRIIQNHISFLSGPHIREIVCSILSENGYENERKEYSCSRIALADFPMIRKLYPNPRIYHKAISFKILCEERIMRRWIKRDGRSRGVQ